MAGPQKTTRPAFNPRPPDGITTSGSAASDYPCGCAAAGFKWVAPPEGRPCPKHFAPHCGRLIPFADDEWHLVFECARSDGRFTPATTRGGAATAPPLRFLGREEPPQPKGSTAPPDAVGVRPADLDGQDAAGVDTAGAARGGRVRWWWMKSLGGQRGRRPLQE
jgi:hypothetical protein